MSDLQRDIEAVERVLMQAFRLDSDVDAWLRLKARLTPDRARVAMAIHDANTHGLKGEDFWLTRADAAIAAMGEP